MDTVAGHDLPRRYLTNAVNSRVLPHSIMFHGPRGVGKSSLAYALAKFATVFHDGPSRGTDSVRKISDGVSSQVLLVEPRGPAGQMTLNGWRPGKDDPDGLQYYRFVDTRPLEGSRKFLLLRRAERMNVALANYLLKLIEEPPSYLSIILMTERPGEVLATIRSRCAPVCLSPLLRHEMVQFATAATPNDLPREAAESFLKAASGCPGRYLDLVATRQAGLSLHMPQLMETFRKYGFLALFRTASDLLIEAEPEKSGEASDATAFETVLDALLAWFRDALLLKTVTRERALPMLAYSAHADAIETWAQPLGLEALVGGVDGILEAYSHTPRQSDKNFVLESLLMRFGRAAKS